MTLFRYKALGKEGTLHKGVLEASSSLEFKVRLQELGLSPIRYSASFSEFQDLTSLFSRKIKVRALMDFCLHLEQFENAGISLKESLEELSRVQEIPKLKKILSQVVKEVERGVLFSSALAKHPSVFDPVFVGLMAVGEKTGRLSFVLQQLAQHLKWMDELQAQIIKALRYPVIMAVLLLVVIIILMTVLVPELVVFIKSCSGELPFSTHLLMNCSSFLSRNLFLLLSGGIFGSLQAMAFFKFHPQGPFWKNRLQEGLPLVGPLRRKFALARFCHLFAVMFGGGVDVLQALQTARKALGAGMLPRTLTEVEMLVQEGQSLSNAFERVRIFPPMVVRMIKMGEKTSALQHNLLHVKDYFDTTLKRQVDHVVGLLEPLMMLGIGSVIAWIVYAIFLPLYGTLGGLDY